MTDEQEWTIVSGIWKFNMHMETSDSLMRLLVGGMFVTFGIIAIIRRKMKIGLGAGRSGTSSSLLTVDVSGRSAVFLGLSQVAGGVLFGLSFVFYWIGDLLSSDVFLEIPSIGVLIAVAGIIVSPLFSNTSQSQNNQGEPM